ncbi:MAG: hypothetical protein AAGC77_12010 [Pseudomonadota bacterium]
MTQRDSFPEFERLLDAYLQLHDMNDAQLSARINSKTYVNKLRKRRSLPGQRKLAEIADVFDITPSALLPGAPLPTEKPAAPRLRVVEWIPVVAIAKAGYWAEMEFFDGFQEGGELGQGVFVPPRSGFPASSQYAVRLEGNSLNKIAPDGAYAICVKFEEWQGGVDLRGLNGQFVHVERRRGDLIESTVKQLKFDADTPALWPHSFDERFQACIPLGDTEGDVVTIIGVVVGTYAEMPIG